MTAPTYTPRRIGKPAISMLRRLPGREKNPAVCIDALAATLRGEGG
jgi:hypothetical protein